MGRYWGNRGGNRDMAEDLVQEACVRVKERGQQYDGKNEFSTLPYALARNLTIDYLRKKNPVSLDGLMEQDEYYGSLEPRDVRPLALDVLARRQQLERISEALIAIPAEYREAIVLRFHDELALAAI